MAEFKKSIGVQERPKPPYDPNKIYKWEPGDQFILSGVEFVQVYQLIKNEALVPGGSSAKQKVDIFNLLEGILGAAVEAGVATEYVEEPPKAEPPFLQEVKDDRFLTEN